MFVVDGTAARILRGTAATLTFQGRDQNGEPADPGTVTVGVTRSDGTVVVAAGTATTAPSTAPSTRTVALTAAQTSQLDVLFATWTVSGTEIAVTRHDVVGGFYYGVDDLRAAEPSTSTDRSVEEVHAVRAHVETLIEQSTGVAFVPRFDVAYLEGNRTCHVVLPRWYLRRFRWIKLWSSNTESSAFTDTACAAIRPDAGGVMRLDHVADGGLVGYMVEVGFEHGMDAPPADVAREALVFARSQGTRGKRSMPEAATSQRLDNGTFITLATPGVGNWHTGIPTVDDMIRRRRRREVQLA